MKSIHNYFSLILITVTISIADSNIHAQAPVKIWDKGFGGNAYEESQPAMQQALDGGYIMGGYSSSGVSGDKSQPSRGNEDYWVVKTDSLGIKNWDACFGGSGGDRNYALNSTSDGGYILGGFTNSPMSGEVSQHARGVADMWIVKINSNGGKQWDRRFGGNQSDGIQAIQQTIDGGYILGGWSYSDSSGDKTQASRGDMDYWIVKTDTMGFKQWDVRFGGTETGDESCISLQQTNDGGYILGGYTACSNTGDKTQPSQGGNDYWIIKINSNGVKQWDKSFGGSSNDRLFAIQQTIDGGYILGGCSSSGLSGDKTEDSQGSDDYWIVKTDSIGAKQWDKRFGGNGSDQLRSIDQTNDGGYILGGWSGSGISGDRTQPSWGSNDYWIVKTNAVGIKEWDLRFGGINNDELRALQQTSDGGYILSGNSASDTTGDNTAFYHGSQDYWLIKTSNCSSPPSAITHSGNQSICNNGYVQLNANTGAGLTYQWRSNGNDISNATDSFYITTQPGIYTVDVHYRNCSSTSAGDTISINDCPVTLNLRVFIEGLYEDSNNMVALNPINHTNVTDIATVELHDSVTSNIISYTTNSFIDVNGYGTFRFMGTVTGNSYYIVVKHRNSVETWSKYPVAFNSTVVSYDFTHE